jgi:hypothetical protein
VTPLERGLCVSGRAAGRARRSLIGAVPAADSVAAPQPVLEAAADGAPPSRLAAAAQAAVEEAASLAQAVARPLAYEIEVPWRRAALTRRARAPC